MAKNKKLIKSILLDSKVTAEYWDIDRIIINKQRDKVIENEVLTDIEESYNVEIKLSLYKDKAAYDSGSTFISKRTINYNMDDVNPSIELFFLNRIKTNDLFFDDATED